MADVGRSSDPWFVDLNGSKPAVLEADDAEKEKFYQKVIDIGRAIQASLPALPKTSIASVTTQVHQAHTPSQLKTRSQPVATSSAPITAIAATSAKRAASVYADGKAQAERAKRLRIEANLRPVSGKHASMQQHKVNGEDIETGIDAADVLTKAQTLVPPVSGLYVCKVPASDSFDENDYYSSQANSLGSSPTTIYHAAAESMATGVLSEGEVSEGEFEPELDPGVLAGAHLIKPNIGREDDAIYEPELAEDNEEAYEPPAVEEPPYEPEPVRPLSQQVVNNAFAGPPLESQVIAVNHIVQPLAPQPSHISPLTSANFAQQLDHSPAHSSDSDHETTSPVKKKIKSKKNKANRVISGAANNRQNQKGSAKKRKREAEFGNTPNRNKRKSQADKDPLIKDEPVSPPPFDFSRLDTRPPDAQQSYNNDGYGIRRPVSQAQLSQVPAGYKLVPIDAGMPPSTPSQYRDSQYREPQYGDVLPPGPVPYGRPIVRDDRGNDYYASTDAYQHVPRPAPNYAERPPPMDASLMYFPPAEHQYHDDAYRRPRLTTGQSLARHVEHGGSPYTEYRHFDDRYHASQPSAAGSSANTYYRESHASSAAPLDHRPPYGYHAAPSVHPTPYSSDPYHQPPSQHQMVPQPPHPTPTRSISVHPQGYGEQYHAHATPQFSAPLTNGRSASVYPRNVSGQMLPPQPRYDGYDNSSMNDPRRGLGRY